MDKLGLRSIERQWVAFILRTTLIIGNKNSQKHPLFYLILVVTNNNDNNKLAYAGQTK